MKILGGRHSIDTATNSILNIKAIAGSLFRRYTAIVTTNHKLLKLSWLLILWLGAETAAQAMIRIEGTRLIYPAKDKEISIRVINDSAETVLLQAWISATEGGSDIPFAVVKPLVELGRQQAHSLRILYAGKGLPSDKESMFLLNIVEAPLKPQSQHYLQMAIRQQLKLFFRPAHLQGSPQDCVAGLTWEVKNSSSIEVANTCDFHLSLVDIEIEIDGRSVLLSKYALLKPRERQYFTLANTQFHKAARAKFIEINDAGLRAAHEQTVKQTYPEHLR